MGWLVRHWRWAAVGMVVAVVGAGAGTFLGREGARPVSVEQAQKRAGSVGTLAPVDSRPAPGVYLYAGTGRDKLSLPPLSQAQGPTMPATVSIREGNCWSLRIDYSTHHWQTWQFCLQGQDLVETAGQFWQVWNVGPLAITNLTTLTCSPPSMVLPASAGTGQSWPTGCSGTSSAVKGTMTNSGTLRYLGPVPMTIGGRTVTAGHFVETRTDQGSQQGTERYETWLAPGTGLPLRLRQDIDVTTKTPFGTSHYTQSGDLTLTSLDPTA